MRAVTLHAFGVTVCGNNDNMKKRHDKKTCRYRKDRFVFFISPFLLLRTSSLDQCNQTKPYERQTVFMIKRSRDI